MRIRRARGNSAGALITGGLIVGIAGAGLCAALLAVLISVVGRRSGCGNGVAAAPGVASIALGPPGSGVVVGATEFGGSGDPSSGIKGALGDNLLEHPDSYAELGGLTWQTATAMGGLPYMAPLRVSWSGHSAIAYKRDFGLGGGPIAGHPRVIDLWWQFAIRLGIPYADGSWSGAVRIERPPDAGAGNLLAQTPAVTGALPGPSVSSQAPAACTPAAGSAVAGVALTPGPRARLLADDSAAAPRSAPPAVKEIIAAGNQIAGKPYVYGAAHGLPLSALAGAYDCSSSVEHLLYGARLLPVGYGAASGELESFGEPGPGRWVTLYANADHVFMYVAGLRWDTSDAAGAGDGSAGIGWHPLVRSAAGFVPRHPAGL
jgi:hypothetical protein